VGKLRILVALGGNAILQHQEKGTFDEQLSNIRRACIHLVEIIESGNQIVITHGNGPQVGDILLKDEMAKELLPPMPLDVCGAESQGMLGYMISRSLREELRRRGINSQVATILTETLVDPNDPAFNAPSKPIGPFYAESEASKLREEKGWTIVSDSDRGYRRVVPSPRPLSVVETSVISRLFDSGVIVIAAGGGGIPIVSLRDGSTRGVEAVIDKDLVAAVLAAEIKADMLLILTDVENVFVDYERPSARPLTRVTKSEIEGYLNDGQFAAGSMRPKVEAAIAFLNTGGKCAVITSLERASGAVELREGTVVTSV
jgi:carbamate kinase